DDGCKEPKKAFIYFQEYLNLGVGRKLSKVAENTGKSDRYIKKLSYTWDWVERANAYDMWLMEENKREFEAETRERYKLANEAGLKSLRLVISALEDNPEYKDIKLGVDAAANLIKRESAVELDTSNGKFTNLSNKEVGDLFRSAMMNGRDGEFKEEDEGEG
ncbi:MAG: hypothetical protein MJ224_07525, partial [archaeon]|nr:hypothetical protein [archaeon]